jgi:hypothetical protein
MQPDSLQISVWMANLVAGSAKRNQVAQQFVAEPLIREVVNVISHRLKASLAKPVVTT